MIGYIQIDIHLSALKCVVIGCEGASSCLSYAVECTQDRCSKEETGSNGNTKKRNKNGSCYRSRLTFCWERLKLPLLATMAAALTKYATHGANNGTHCGETRFQWCKRGKRKREEQLRPLLSTHILRQPGIQSSTMVVVLSLLTPLIPPVIHLFFHWELVRCRERSKVGTEYAMKYQLLRSSQTGVDSIRLGFSIHCTTELAVEFTVMIAAFAVDLGATSLRGLMWRSSCIWW